jgi:broad specificity phosphatase PhoE
MIFVARHAERLDYAMRNSGSNWLPTADKPWDAPLTTHGLQTATSLNTHLTNLCEKTFSCPQITRVFSSPMLRCVQTAANATANAIPICIDKHLVESCNESWYRSWCCPGSNATWGGPNDKRVGTPIEESELHPLALVDVETIYNKPEDLAQMQMHEDGNEDGGSFNIDVNYESRLSFAGRQWGNFESDESQSNRMAAFCEHLQRTYPGESILLVSHGGPCLHCYESLSGEKYKGKNTMGYAHVSAYEIDRNNSDNANANDDKEGKESGQFAWKCVLKNDMSYQTSNGEEEVPSQFVEEVQGREASQS